MKVSVIICNYNYGRFVGEAIESALALEWPDKEVIVVDDGSTDSSHEVIEGFGPRICAIFKSNGGQNDSLNHAMQVAAGEIVFFLDSDDMLLPSAAADVAKVMRPGVNKVQFPMTITGMEGEISGLLSPNFPQDYDEHHVRMHLERIGWYLSSPTSGNAWSRTFLRRVFPLPTKWNDTVRAVYCDGYLSTLAACTGDVVTIRQPLALYRQNSARELHFSARELARIYDEERARLAYTRRKLAELRGYIPQSEPGTAKSMMHRMVYRKFLPREYPMQESWLSLMAQSYRSVIADPTVGWKTKGLLLAWFTAVAFLPRRLSNILVQIKYVPSYRPKFVVALLRASGWLGRA
jgi:glycosyltransferase involved in cell wall biosynthesis